MTEREFSMDSVARSEGIGERIERPSANEVKESEREAMKGGFS